MTSGIHHITAIASNAKKTLYFYSHILGLRLVKKTVNQDDVETYHLFFGDRVGHPGMDLTFFIFLPTHQGNRGLGLVTTISLKVPIDSLEFWQKRLKQYSVKQESIVTRFGQKRLIFYDDDDQRLELVEHSSKHTEKNDLIWTTTEILEEHAIQHFYSATLKVHAASTIEPILTQVFGYTKVQSEGQVHLFSVKNSNRANNLELHVSPNTEQGRNAAGTVHHIAFRAGDEKQQMQMREKVLHLGLHPTEVINRFYFQSVYFRTPAGILFEIATDGPGFTADENDEMLGSQLALPPFLEEHREMIESQLRPHPSELTL